MRIIILENGTSTSDYFSRAANIPTDNYSSIEELLQKDYTQGCIVVAVRQDLDTLKLDEICNQSLFSLVITDNPSQLKSSKVYTLPTSTNNETIVTTAKTLIDNMSSKSKGFIKPLPHSDFDSAIYEALKRDMLNAEIERSNSLRT